MYCSSGCSAGAVGLRNHFFSRLASSKVSRYARNYVPTKGHTLLYNRLVRCAFFSFLPSSAHFPVRSSKLSIYHILIKKAGYREGKEFRVADGWVGAFNPPSDSSTSTQKTPNSLVFSHFDYEQSYRLKDPQAN